MLELATKGSKTYWAWIIFLLVLIGVGGGAYMIQWQEGLVITGLSRDVSWGFYIAQFTYLVGVAASAVMLVLPYYLHNYKAFSKMIILGEFLAIAAVVMCLGFIVVDLGQPQRLMNVILHPTPRSILFWDMVVLNGYLFLNIVIGWLTLMSERKGIPIPSWVKPLIILSIFWAFSIHTVTAFLYAGLPGRHYWLTAILAARFLASAFASGPAILLLLALLAKKIANYDVGKEAISTLAKIIAYAMGVNVFFFLLEVFTAFYSQIPGHTKSIVYLFAGYKGQASLVPWMWTAAVLAIASLVLLAVPKLRNNHQLLPFSLILLVIATWIDKGLGLIVGGFVPNMFNTVTEYAPTLMELAVSMAVYATGALILTVLWKVGIGVKKEVAGEA
ncbi:MAG: sulfate reduction electron transfer complex DsrMKJOP subunit DsrP [Desulfovibrionales bacterium]